MTDLDSSNSCDCISTMGIKRICQNAELSLLKTESFWQLSIMRRNVRQAKDNGWVDKTHSSQGVGLSQGRIIASRETNYCVSKQIGVWTAVLHLTVQSAAETKNEPSWHWAVCLAHSFVLPLHAELMDSAPKHFETSPQCEPGNSSHTSPRRTTCHIWLQPLLSWVRCWGSNEVTTARLNIQIYSHLTFICLHIYIIICITRSGNLKSGENVISLGQCL